MKWEKGESGNPNGTTHGTLLRRNITNGFLRDLHADWLKHGVNAIERVREEEPGTYLKVVASLVPKEVKLDADLTVSLIDVLAGIGTSPSEHREVEEGRTDTLRH